jgi:inosose dehydratase
MRMRTKNVTRREALAGVAAALLPSPAMAATYKPKVSVACYIWTQQFVLRKMKPIDGLEEAYGTFQRTGYHYVELINSFLQGELKDRTIELMKKYKLRCSMAYNGGVMHDDAGAEKTIAATLDIAQAAKSLGADGMVINCDPLPRNGRKSNDQLRTEAANLNRLGRELKSRGMRVCLHHHAPDLTEHGREWLYMLHNTDPQLVWMCPDPDWIRFAKLDVLNLIREAGKRIGDIHLRNSEGGVWTEDLGPGEVDYVGMAQILREIKYNEWVSVELGYANDTRITRSLEENLRRSREYAERTFGAKA